MHVQVIRYIGTGDDEIETNWGLLGEKTIHKAGHRIKNPGILG